MNPILKLARQALDPESEADALRADIDDLATRPLDLNMLREAADAAEEDEALQYPVGWIAWMIAQRDATALLALWPRSLAYGWGGGEPS